MCHIPRPPFMRAFVSGGYNCANPLSTLVYTEHPKPTISKSSQVLVKINYASVNPADVMYMKGIYKNAPYKPQPQFPCPLGTDGSGVVVAIGSEVKKLHVGDTVFGLHADVTHGTFAEFAIFEESELAIFEEEYLTAAQAAGIPLVYTSAFVAFMCWKPEYFNAIPSQSVVDTVVVRGASGGIGGWCVILAKYYFKAKKVIAICSGKNAEYVIGLGADSIIDYITTDVVQSLKQEYSIDLVIDTVGGAEWAKSVMCLMKPENTFITLVPPYIGEKVDATIWDVGNFVYLMGWNAVYGFVGWQPKFHFAGARPNGAILHNLVNWVKYDKNIIQKIQCIKITEMAFNELPKALEDIETKRTVGKIVISIKSNL